MKKNFIALIITAMLATVECFGWSQKGHDVVCTIAQRHLTEKASSIVADLLDGRSMVYWANWLDNASNTPAYAYSKTWHYKDVDMGSDYNDMADAEKGDIETALNLETKILQDYVDGKATKDEATLAVKFIIHLVGDLHQPMHVGRTSDLGGNRHPVQFFNNKTNLHSLWDGSLVESAHKWSHTEWAEEIDRGLFDEDTLAAGTFHDWGRETWMLSVDVYLDSPQDTKLMYDYVAKWTPVIEGQFLKAGIRLAHVLNSILK